MAPRIDDQEAVVVSGAPDIQQVQEDPAVEEIVTVEKKTGDDLKAEQPVGEQKLEALVESSAFACFDFNFFDTCCGAKVEKTCDHCGLPITSDQGFVIRNGEYIHTDFCLADLELATEKHHALQALAIEEEMKAQARREAAEQQKAALSELLTKAQLKEMERSRIALELEELARKKASQEEAALRRQAAEAWAEAEVARLAELARREELARSMEVEKLKKKKGFWARLFGGCSCKKADSAVDTSKPPLKTTGPAVSGGAVETSKSAFETTGSAPSKPVVETVESVLETTGSADAALDTIGSAESKASLEKARSAESKAEVETRESALDKTVSAAE